MRINLKTKLSWNESLLLLFTFIFTVLIAWFVVPNSLYLLDVGFTLDNIIRDELPKDYITGDGSVFNAVTFVLQVGLPVAVFLWALTIVMLWRKMGPNRKNVIKSSKHVK